MEASVTERKELLSQPPALEARCVLMDMSASRHADSHVNTHTHPGGSRLAGGQQVLYGMQCICHHKLSDFLVSARAPHSSGSWPIP